MASKRLVAAAACLLLATEVYCFSAFPIQNLRSQTSRLMSTSSSFNENENGPENLEEAMTNHGSLSEGGLWGRRDLLKAAGVGAAAAAASILGLPENVLAEGPKKTVVITGANSGVGLTGARQLVESGHDVFLACRTLKKAKTAAEQTGAAGYFECDLSSLESVRKFAKDWDNTAIDALCLNAGMAPNTKGSPKFTDAGFEETIGVNHLGHFLLANLLLKNLESSSLPQPRLVVTASSVHDPDQPGGDVGSTATLGDLSGLKGWLDTGKFEMVDGNAYDGDKAYKDSKLCNVLFTEECQRRLDANGSKVTVNCFSPGLIPSTGLFRNQNPLFTKAFDIATSAAGVATTAEAGGTCLSYMVTSSEIDSIKGKFFATQPGKPKSPFAEFPVSKEAQDMEKAKELWKLSAQLVNIWKNDVSIGNDILW